VKLEFLITLDAILKTGSFANAAQEVGLTPSAVSLQVKRLEEYLGRPLFDRSGRTAKPTPLAIELSESVSAALEAMEAARQRSTVAVSGRVVLGAIRTLQLTVIPLVLREISDRYPELSVKVIQGDSVELLGQLKAGELDAAAVIRPTTGGSSRLAWSDLAEQRFVFVAPPDSEGDSFEALIARYGWLQFDTSLTGGRVAASLLHRLAPGARPRFELESVEAVMAMIAAGQGVSILPRLDGETSSAYRVRVMSLGVEAPSRKIAFVCRSADADNRRIGALRNAFSACYDAMSS
jgi:DNA-binding transcriptional LysR family regulator